MRFALLCLLVLTACGPAPKDYNAMAKCSSLGYEPNTDSYKDCVDQESKANLLAKHRADMDRRHEQEERNRTLRGFY